MKAVSIPGLEELEVLSLSCIEVVQGGAIGNVPEDHGLRGYGSELLQLHKHIPPSYSSEVENGPHFKYLLGAPHCLVKPLL
ncbi:hypothetical protein AVEN_59968-1 [Araneus ventricosus]|uniref:Uncharacterized protein n=1 Tax=Araneus ventricosus TaxID=182803 RepID=A0A4Y2W000_ARAVE|nr:hypothetical protein AVEN_59968-1 [Araneus ventricosus]